MDGPTLKGELHLVAFWTVLRTVVPSLEHIIPIVSPYTNQGTLSNVITVCDFMSYFGKRPHNHYLHV